MRLARTLAFIAFGLSMLYVALAHGAPSTHKGSWALRKAEETGKVYFSISEHHSGGGYSQSSSDWPVSSFEGLDLSKPGRQDARFKIVRDAGTLECEGYLDNGEGGGLFSFQPDPSYPGEMKALGFPVNQDDQFSMAVHDVSLSFAREIKDAHLTGLDADKLLTFRIHGVDAQFIRDLRAADLNVSDSDKLVDFRIHGVTPEMVRTLHQMGYTPDEDMLVAMKIHGATPEFIQQLSSLGYDHLDLDDVISFRIHGVSPEFIQKLAQMGYSHPAPDELVSMRIHGVTPDYISDLRARGLQNLSIDQLISMKIHGL